MKKVLLPVLFASAGLMLLAGCKKDPTSVVKNYIKAADEGDAIAARKLVMSDNGKMKTHAKRSALEGIRRKAIKNAKFRNGLIKDDEAEVYVTMEVTQVMKLKKVGGEWKVADVRPFSVGDKKAPYAESEGLEAEK